MSFEPVHLVNPKTGEAVTANTAVDLTNFRFNDGYIPLDDAKLYADKLDDEAKAKYPGLDEGIKAAEGLSGATEAPAEESSSETDKPETERTTGKPTGRGGKSATESKSGTDASGQQVGVN